MARASEEFVLAWQSLPIATDGTGWQSIPVTAPSASCLVRAGKSSPHGRESVLVGFAGTSVPPAEKLPEGQGFAVERVSQSDDVTWLALTRSESGHVDLFLAMVCDVIGLLDQASSTDQFTLLRLFLERVRAWQEFMRKGVTALSHEKEVGLFGELVVVQALLAGGLEASAVMDSWKGPLDGQQDFSWGTGAIEVKTTLAQCGFTASVGSLQQLDDAAVQPLFVCGVKLRQAVDGQSLTALVVSLRSVLHLTSAKQRFELLLLKAGYFEVHAPQYLRTFDVAEVRYIEVTDGFPRLTIGRVPKGVVDALYTIDLDQATGESYSLMHVLNTLGVTSK